MLALVPAVAAQSGPPLDTNLQIAASATAQSDLVRGISLTGQGRFAEAIPLLLASKAGTTGGYAVEFNLALCYVGSGRYVEAIVQLVELQHSGFATAAVSNLLAQAYVGQHDAEKAWPAIQSAIQKAPFEEKMYAYLLNACTDHFEYALGLQTATLGLRSLPESSRLHYERAVFLARLDRLEEAEPEFRKAASLDPQGDIGQLATVQRLLYEDDLPHALEAARKAVTTGDRDPQMLSLLGTVLMYTGIAPGQPQFAEARSALETSVAEQPGFSTAQIALGKLYLIEDRPADAVVRLEIGRRLEPRNPAAYTSLAAAYRRLGNKEASAECLETLAGLLHEKTTTGPSGKPQESAPQ